MACGRDPSLSPQEKRTANPLPSTTTTIDSLGDDIILDIFLRLPSFTALVRAAFARQAWRRSVASSPSFRRRFLALHPAPLLGLFFSPFNDDLTPNIHVFPPFAPSRFPDQDLASVIRTGDFFLTSIQARTGAAPDWHTVDCRRGFVLLIDWISRSYALLNPLTRQIHGFFDMPFDILAHHCEFSPIIHDTQLICSDEDPLSFRIICLAHDDSSMIRAAVFSTATREWSILPWVEVSPRPHCENFCEERDDESKCEYICLEGGMQDSGSFIYWPFKNQKSFIKLDTTTMEFSVAQLPLCLKNQSSIRSFVMGETKDGSPCIVYTEKFNIGVLLHDEDDGCERWVLDRLHLLKEQVKRVLGNISNHVCGLNVVTMRNGYVYLKAVEMGHNPLTPCWFLSLRLETMEIEKVSQ